MFFSSRSSILAAIIVTVTRGCGNQDTGGSSTAPAATGAPVLPAAVAPAAQPSTTTAAAREEEEVVPKEKFSDAQRAFATAKDALLKDYYNDGLREEDLYRGALQGMLEHAEPKLHKWNKLLSPTEV